MQGMQGMQLTYHKHICKPDNVSASQLERNAITRIPRKPYHGMQLLIKYDIKNTHV